MPEAQPTFSPTQEVRFALVMYGGSSLCIYMNGVAQEFLNLVRSTAPSAPLSQNPSSVRPATSTEKVYRKLGQLLCYGLEPRREAAPDADITTRFVVDIISGSSAGGINGVFLARALANDKPLDQLKRLWVEEGDFARLLNDKGSIGQNPKIELRIPPESLMNSHRMYYRLLEAFQGMGERDGEFESPLVEELDLAVTTTDLKGLTMPIKLYDSVVLEPRYRNVFHLKYRTRMATGRMQNDFADFHHGLAFVARCTSSFPLVFEPMTLDDVNWVASKNPGIPGVELQDSRWDKVYFPEYVRVGDRYRLRPFSDGGDIDNKPFSYAIENLTVRRSTVPVVRKLVYVEPDPGQYELGVDAGEWINPISSVLLAGTLPRKETIREDLDRVRAHNVVAKRVAEAIETVELVLEEDQKRVLEADRKAAAGAGKRMPPKKNREAAGAGDQSAPPREDEKTTITGEKVSSRDEEATTDWVKERGEPLRLLGLPYRMYHRTKVQQTIAQLGRLLAEAAGHDAESDRGLAVRLLVQSWVAAKYADPFEDAPEGDDRPTERQFLLDFDLEYRMRRINFIERRADELLCHGNPRSRRLLKLAVGREEPPGGQAAFDAALKDAKLELNAAFVGLRRFRWRLGQDMAGDVAQVGIEPSQLDAILVNQPVQQVLHAVSVDGGPPVTFDGDPKPFENPRVPESLTFTTLALRPGETMTGLDRGAGGPATLRIVGWAAGGPVREEARMGLDASSVLVVDLPRPARRVALTVSALAWPPDVEAYGAEGQRLDAAVTPTAARPDTGQIRVDAEGTARVVVRSRTGALATAATPLERAATLLSDTELRGRIEGLAEGLRGRFVDTLKKASSGVSYALRHGDDAAVATDPGETARKALDYFFKQFDGYDMATLPLLLTYSGEAAQVDVLRVSPYDATSLVPASKAKGKLAGNQLGHYGAFLSAAWRRSDIMWGRLDAAERLITALLPAGHPQRDALVKEAQEIILTEELAGVEMSQALEKAVLGGDTAAVPEAVERLRQAVEKTASPGALRESIRQKYELPPGPDPHYKLDVASRATRIVGDILKGMSEPGLRRPAAVASGASAAAGGSRSAPASGLKWPGRILAGVGHSLWGLVQIAVPGTLWWRIARYYLSLLVFIELFLIVSGVVLNQRPVVRFGWLTLGITLFLILAKAVMKEILRSGNRLLIALAALVAAVALGLMVFGGVRALQNAQSAACDGKGLSKYEVVQRAQPFNCRGVTPAASTRP